MKDSLRFHSQVPHDLAEAIAWYEEISPSLANRFRKALKAAFNSVRSYPNAYGVVFDDVRVMRVARFPYLVQYRMSAEVPCILGVFHSASDPSKWQKRAESKE